METNHDHTDQQPLLDAYTKSTINATAKIAGVSAILSLAGTLVSAAAYFIRPETATTVKEGFGSNSNVMQPTALSVIFALLLNGLLFYQLYRFSRVSRSALQNDQPLLLDSGLLNLAAYFRICAILLIISIGSMLLIAFTMAGGAALR